MNIPLREIARHLGVEVVGDQDMVISGINALSEAGPSELSFYFDRRYQEALHKTRAGALLVTEATPTFSGPQLIALRPHLAYSKAIALFSRPVERYDGVSPQAFIARGVEIGKDVSIYPGVYVGADSKIGDHSILFPGCFVGERVRIGKRTLLYPNVTVLRDCMIGNDVIIHAGTVIGSDGFGFVRDGARSVKLQHLGFVQIDDEVEIGANNCIDRAAFGKTWIRRGTKTDNLVQIAHNVQIGEDTIIVAQAGISGSCSIGSRAMIGGQVGIIDHIEVGDGAMIGSQSGVAKDIPAGQAFSGYPAMAHRQWLRTTALTNRLPQMNDRVKTMEKRLETLERRLSTMEKLATESTERHRK